MRAQVTGKLGFYNNWFVTKISWWLDEPRVAQFIGAFDRSNLIFTVRSNDLIFQTAAIKLFMPKSRRRRYSDFSYQHHTIRNGSVLYGGIEAGWRDDGGQALLAAYASKTTGTHRARDANVTDRVAFRTWTTGDLVVRRCAVQEELDGPFRETLYVSPVLDATRAHGQGRGTRSGPTRRSTSARTGIETRRRVSGRTGRRRTYGCGAATSRSTSTARSGRRTTSRRRTTRRRRMASGPRISSRPSAGRGAGRRSSN